MSDYTPLTPQEIYAKDIAEAGEEGLVPETRIEYFLNKIATEGGGGSSDSDVLLVNVTFDNGSPVTDKTYAEITEAYEAGKIIFADIEDYGRSLITGFDYGSGLQFVARIIICGAESYSITSITQYELFIDNTTVDFSEASANFS